MNPQLQKNNALEGIDLNKLGVVVRNNWFWLLLIFFIVNSVSVLYVRYTKNLYESSSELKLDVKDNATQLGIRSVTDDHVNLLAGEIEIIQSKLFLTQVLNQTPIDVSYFSMGRVTNEELFSNKPFHVEYKIINPSILNTPIHIEGKDAATFALRIANRQEIKGRYGEPTSLSEAEITLFKDDRFKSGDEIGYFFILNSQDVLLNYLINNLSAEPLNYNANTIRISFKDYNPSKAQRILQKIDTLYLQYSNEQKNLANLQQIKWLSNELSLIEQKMEGIEDYFENFTLQNKTNNLDEDLTKTVFQINEIDSQRYNLNLRVNSLNRLYEALQQNDYKTSLVNSQYLPERLNKNIDELFTLVLEQEKLKMSYSEVTFAFRQRQQEIENIRNKSLAHLEELRNEAIARAKALDQRKRQLENEFAGLPDKNTEFTKNMRFYKLNEQLYLMLMQSKSEFEVMQAGSTPDYKILSPASYPTSPISPQKGLILGASLVISLVLMLLTVGILYLANNKITSLAELENAIAVPVLGVVPTSRYIKIPGKISGLFAVEHPKSMVSEALRTIRTNLDFFNFKISNRVIAISSTVSGEGKSFIAMNLGAMIALSTKKVILIDLDMRKPKTNLPFEVSDSSQGVSTVLIGKSKWKDCIVKTKLENLDYLPSGPHPPNPAELLLNTAFTDLLNELKENYDYVVLDTPPVGMLSDGIMAMKQADLCIYIFRASYSKRVFITNLQRLISINKFPNMTMVLNALPHNSENKYGYGYYEEWQNESWWKKRFKT